MKEPTYSYRSGVISSIKGEFAFVTLTKKIEKPDCSAKGCNLCATDTPPVKIKISGEDLRLGETVNVGTVQLNEALASFLAFGLPIIASLVFYFIAVSVLNWDGESGMVIGVTLLVLITSVLGISIINRLITAKYPVKVTRADINEQCDDLFRERRDER